jgi:hypothetical protein
MRPRKTLVILVALAALCALGPAAPAAFADYHDVIRECYNTGQLTPGKYSRHELLQARHHLPTDIKEYSDCEDLINEALAAGNKKGGGGNSAPPGNPSYKTPSGAFANSQDDLNALDQATKPGPRPSIAIAGSKLSPSTGGVINAAKNTGANSLPLPLLLSLIALATMTVLAGASVLRGRWPQIRSASLRLLRR